MSEGWKRTTIRDRVVAGGAGVTFIAGFLPWWGGAVDRIGRVSSSGWSVGFAAWAGTLLLTVAGVLVVLRRGVGVSRPIAVVGSSMLVAAVSAIGVLLVFIRWLSLSRLHGFGRLLGPQYGIYVALVAGVVEVAAAVSEVVASGGQVSWRHSQPADAKPQG